MEKQKRKIEVFTAGCLVCNPVVEMVKSLASAECDVIIYNLSEPSESKTGHNKVQAYGVKSLPAIALDGKLLSQYMIRGISDSELNNAGIGSRSGSEKPEYSSN